MKALFSEFSYGFALTHELINVGKHLLAGAPRLPSLRSEGQAGGGYDLELPVRGYPLFLQFKVSEYMVRASAAEWKKFNSEYFRMQLHPLRHSQQHHLLLDLENDGNFVYYAAPAFYRAQDLNEAFRKSDVVRRTVFVRPSDIGRLPDNENHCLAFRLGDRVGYFFSEVRREVPLSAPGDGFLEEIGTRRHRADRAPLLNEEFLTSLANRMTDLVYEQVAFDDDERRAIVVDLPPLDRVVYLARTFFDSEILWVRAAGPPV